MASTAASTPVPVSGIARVEGGWGVDGDLLVLPGLHLPLQDVPVEDPAFRLDLAAAGAAAVLAGATSEAVRKAIEGFVPISHRRTLVGTWHDVTWVDDSKATNPHSALAAVRAYPSVVLIAGGRNKDLELAPIVQRPEVRAVVAIGEAATDVLAAAGALPAVRADSMREAVKAASDLAEPGDTVLLAPGCASFDMFESYGHRGEAFREAVLELEGQS